MHIKGINMDDFIKSLGTPDMNADENIDETDLFLFEEIMDDEIEEEY